MLTYLLNENWKMKKSGTDRAYETSVPATMYSVLFEHGVIDDPFYGENDKIQTKLSDDDYSFEKVFEVSEELMACEVIELDFKGLDTLATIKLNDLVIAKTNNMHRTYTFDVKQYLTFGENKLVVYFDSPTKYIAAQHAKDPLWGVTSTIEGYGHLRKAHHMFGWDWGPQMPDMGIWRDVQLRGIQKGKLQDFYVEQSHGKNKVELDIQVSTTDFVEGLTIQIELLDQDGALAATGTGAELVKLHGDVQVIAVDAIGDKDRISSVSLTVDEPKLWWPNGYGRPHLYEMKIQLMDGSEVIDVIVKKIGLRTMTVTREADKWGESFDFTINGKRIFAMGADYIPEDTLITRPTYETTKRLIKDCAKANYNCLRVWGGAYYPNDNFFNLCDEYGLLVWEDFMFACGVYRLTDNFKDNITQEFIDNIKRIRHHACLGLWCGNNEMEWGFVEWGLPKDERLRMDYLLMYEKLIPDVLAAYDPQTFYWPASPSSGGGFDKPNDDNKGDVHYWNVFHGNEHYKKFRDHYFRFASEYGMQAFPDYKTIKSYTPEDQMNAFSPVMEDHNKCIDPMNGNIKILLNMSGEFQLPKEFEDQVYISQVFQAETIKCAVEHYRRNRGRCMGSTYWQVNDNYPVASWASIDFYGRWKAMHYFAKRFYAPVLLSAFEEGTRGHIHVTNEQLDEFTGKVKWQLRHIETGILEDGEIDIQIDPLCAEHILDVSIEKYVENYGDERNIYLSYQLLDSNDETLSSETILFTYHKYFNFDKVNITSVAEEKDGEILITLTSNTLAKSVGLHFETLDIVLSDNFFDILPGESVTVKAEEIIGDDEIDCNIILEQMKIIGVNTIEY